MKLPGQFLTLLSFAGFWLWSTNGSASVNSNHPSGLSDLCKTSYEISLHGKQSDVLKVRFRTTVQDSILYMAEGADHLPRRWATFIHNVSAFNDHGERLIVEELEEAEWKVHASPGQHILVTYDYQLDHMNHEWSGGLDGVAYMTDWGNFYTGKTLFLLNGTSQQDICLRFDVPGNWKITHPWVVIDSVEGHYQVAHSLELIQSMFFIGMHEELRFSREGFELIFALGGQAVIAEREKYGELAGGVLDYYTRLMEGLPNPPPDNPLNRSVVIINEAGSTDGEVIGNNISIMVDYEGDPMSKMLSNFIFAHEFFHLWNGKSFRPDDDRCEWFKEGFTNYYTLKALKEVGLLDEEAYLGVLNSLFFQRYTQDDGLGTISLTAGHVKHDHWGLIYAGGLFTAIAQDIIIRKNTGNEKSLDDLMRQLYLDYAGTEKTYSLENLETILSKLSLQDQHTFFRKHITGTEPIPIEEFLSMASFDAHVEGGSLIIKRPKSATALESEIIKGFFGKL